MEGLYELVNLQYLDISMHNIEKIEGLDKLMSLRDLNLIDNKINKIENIVSYINNI